MSFLLLCGHFNPAYGKKNKEKIISKKMCFLLILWARKSRIQYLNDSPFESLVILYSPL